MPSNAIAILADVTTGFRNNVRRMRSGTLRDRTCAKGKENRPPVPNDASSSNTSSPVNVGFRVPNQNSQMLNQASTATLRPGNTISITVNDVEPQPELPRWEPVDGTIIIKVRLPSIDDIWRFKVPCDIALEAFREKVVHKIGFPVGFTKTTKANAKLIVSEDAWKRWIAGRVKDGRNRPLVAVEPQ
ncbi:unnamed protein product [Somion occarium]|uniref:Uncharacterized protein n=1 Tax=Somion occarium TaxID=3059160 RepID=A0ABP1DMN9_9APHY